MKSKREQRHASIVFKSGTPVGFGYNNGNFHAEERAITQASLMTGTTGKGATMLNIRLTHAGKIALSRPCPSCYELLKAKKFRKVIYSNNEGGFTEEYL